MMKKYEVLREIYNSCSGGYFFDINFSKEIETTNIEDTLKDWFDGNLPEYSKESFTDGTIVYVLFLPLMERYTFSEI